jgi:uncharacterized protein YndB with AHSA1/START domain
MTPRPAAIAVQTFKVSPERVYDAILDPAMIARFMFGSLLREEEILHIQNDPRLGGEFSFKVRRDIPGQGPTEIDHIGRYLELVRPQRIVFSWGILGESDPDESTVAIDIVSTPDGCSLTLTHSMSPEWADFIDRARDSWAKMLGVLARLLD